MFEIIEEMLIKLVDYIPYLFGLYLMFDLIGGLLFNKK